MQDQPKRLANKPPVDPALRIKLMIVGADLKLLRARRPILHSIDPCHEETTDYVENRVLNSARGTGSY